MNLEHTIERRCLCTQPQGALSFFHRDRLIYRRSRTCLNHLPTSHLKGFIENTCFTRLIFNRELEEFFTRTCPGE